MNMELDKMAVKLSNSVNELELSIIHAYDSFLQKYGPGHKYVDRLESYFSAIDKQREYIEELQKHLKNEDLAMIYEVSSKIVAISDMVKNDAKAFLYSINSDDKEDIAETVH